MPAQLTHVLDTLEAIRKAFHDAQQGNIRISMADMIVLAGAAAVEEAARKAGYDLVVPLIPGRVDATQEWTDVAFWEMVEPTADGFRNYYDAQRAPMSPEEMLVDRAQLLTLSAPEMTVLLGGLRVLGAVYGNTGHGVLTERPETLTNDFFVHLLDMDTVWRPLTEDRDLFEGVDRQTGKRRWTVTRADLIFGANAQLRAIAEVYAADDAGEKFVRDFVKAWVKVMHLDRFDLSRHPWRMSFPTHTP